MKINRIQHDRIQAYKGLRISLISFFLVFLSVRGYSATYYVSTTGNDANNGASASPFKTIAKAASVVNAGDIVLIAAGTYSEYSITPKSSGTEGNYII